MTARTVWLLALLLCCWSGGAWAFQAPVRKEKGPAVCAPDCSKNGGNCGEDGFCRCPFGRLGEACEIDFLGPCRQSPDTPALCSEITTKSCECMKRCRDYFCRQDSANVTRCEWHVHYRPERGCYERKGVPPDLQYSNIPEENEDVIYRWWSNENQTLNRSEALTFNVDVSLPISKCPDQCNKRGYCVAWKDDKNQTPMCRCYRDFEGHKCEVENNRCYLGCNGKGKCKDSFCHCEPPYFSIGCSRSTVYPANHSRPSPVNFKIYMYELSTQLAHENALMIGWKQHDSIYIAYQKFLEQFLLSPVRTEDPSEANMFFIPAFTYSYSGNVGNGDEHLNLLLDHIRNQYPWWNRTGGRDHFLWMTNDRGACHVSGMSFDPIKLAHFGMYTTPNKHHEAFGHKGHPEYGCFHPLKDVLAVPYDPRVMFFTANTANKTVDEVMAKKKHMFFFAGGVRPSDPEYSGGTRVLMQKLILEWADPEFGFVEGGVGDYEERLRISKYCLVPYGHGWGNRLAQAMTTACIPVVVQEHVWQPYEELLPYSRFSVRLSNEDLPFLREILRGISEQQYRGMVAELLRYYQAFSWEADRGGRAFDYTIETLQLRYKNLKAKFY